MVNTKSSDTTSPILNNPYEEPLFHYDTDAYGNLDYSKVLEGRRPYSSGVVINPGRTDATLFTGADFEGINGDPNAKFINEIRAEVGKWRREGYPKVTRVTRELLKFWFENPERPPYLSLFFCQREAIETAIYLNEVADRDPNIGRNILARLTERQESVGEIQNQNGRRVGVNPENVLPRTAFKMATGTGKTVVMAMLIVYNYLNKKEDMQNTNYADHFLIVTPGVTIRDRLGVLRMDDSSKSTYEKNDYYHQRMLIPRHYEQLMEGINSCITIVNYQQFLPKVYSDKKASPLDGKVKFDGKEMKKNTEGKESFNNVLNRVLGRHMRGRRLIVINDEAHHCYLPKQVNATRGDDDGFDIKAENEYARVWYEGIRNIKLQDYKLNHVYDLSATPYYIKGSGYPEYSLFPWTVSDFGLIEAIESGLVKIPYLPTFDNTKKADPKLKNIYAAVKDDLPKKPTKKTDTETVAAPKLPAQLCAALDQFVTDYTEYDNNVRESGEAEASLFSAPPVMIIVCNNTAVSQEVYKYVAGYTQGYAPDGTPINIPGHFNIFSNYDGNRMPKQAAPTLLIDSNQLDMANNVIDENFKTVFRSEIEAFKREYAIQYGSGSADKLTDADILREVVNTVGKPGKLGASIRCVVSVSMLTEGWDANTVTHVCGIRAFGSQLLCEQVAGRALRRRNYELRKYDAKTGEELPEDTKRKKDVILKFPPEYARIIGVPFTTFKSGATATSSPAKPKTIIMALEERSDMEIQIPNVRGYRVETPDGIITADFTDVPKFKLDFNEVAYHTTMQSAVDAGALEMEVDYKDIRDAEVIFKVTKDLISEKYNDPENGRQFQLFPQLKKVVEQWYDTQIEIINGNGDPNLRRLIKLWDTKKIVANIYEGIHLQNASNVENISAILDYYNPVISTSNVWGSTSKPVQATVKSHVNYVVADSSWEQTAASQLDQMPEVRCYVKNSFLGFVIPYMLDDEEHEYVTDFIAVCKTPSGEEVNIIIEISGMSNDYTGHKDAKRYYTCNYWIPAVNKMKKYGRWEFIEVHDENSFKELLLNKIASL